MKYVIYIAVGLITAISLFTACEKEDVVPQGDVQMTDVDRFIASEAYQAYSKVKRDYAYAYVQKYSSLSKEEQAHLLELYGQISQSEDESKIRTLSEEVYSLLGDELKVLAETMKVAAQKVFTPDLKFSPEEIYKAVQKRNFLTKSGETDTPIGPTTPIDSTSTTTPTDTAVVTPPPSTGDDYEECFNKCAAALDAAEAECKQNHHHQTAQELGDCERERLLNFNYCLAACRGEAITTPAG